MQSILVTGGAGFIGGTFVRRMVPHTDAFVVNLDCLTYAGNLQSLAAMQDRPNYKFIRGNINDQRLVQQLLNEHRCTAVVNFAAESHVDRSISNPDAFVHTNVLGTFRLLEAALAYYESLDGSARAKFRFLHVSTDEVYGTLGPTGRFVESTPYAPNSPYSASKASSDHFVRAYHHTYGLPTLITNCSNNYGPYQFPEKLIPLMIRNALRGKKLPVYGTGSNVRDWLYVEDHCRALQMVLARGTLGEVYNIGGNCELTNLEVVRTICRTVERLAPDLPVSPVENLIEFVVDRPGHDFRYAIDTTKIQSELGWTPETDFATGIARTVRWYIDNNQWVTSVCDGSYQGERLGLREQGATAGDSRTKMSECPVCEIDGVLFFPISFYRDARGWLAELFRHDEIPVENRPVMSYVSETKPGVSRGPHEHVSQSDFFAFVGPGNFRLYLWDARAGSPTFGKKCTYTVGESNPQAVIVPPGVVHAYANPGPGSAWVFNAPNRLYAGEGKREPVDEIRHETREGTPSTLSDD